MENLSNKLNILIERMKSLQTTFYKEQGVNDLWSNSKVYEIIIANGLSHNLIPGHSGSRDAIDNNNIKYEYKHFKKLSSNHSWTFNDYSENTIKGLIDNEYRLIFAHINDENYPPKFDWYYQIEGIDVGNYLAEATKSIKNNRKMINISENQIKRFLVSSEKIFVKNNYVQKYQMYLKEIFDITEALEKLTGVKNSLTSNKFWEIFIAYQLGHKVNSEQGGRKGAHDAYDEFGNSYEYKVSKSFSWNFQDISNEVLDKYYNDAAIILAVVDKENFLVKAIFSVKPQIAVPFIKEKLKTKMNKLKIQNKEIRRKQISLSKGDLKFLQSSKLF